MRYIATAIWAWRWLTRWPGPKGALDGGQDVYINTTINGIGERAGNADLVAVILAVLKSKGFADKYEMGDKLKLSQGL